jgi:hypothetical protein
MNVRPKHYSWPEFYDRLIDLTSYSFSWPRILKRHRATAGRIPRWMNFIRAVSSEGFGRIRYFKTVRRLLDDDHRFRSYLEQETTELPQFYLERVRQSMGPMWEWLPKGALYHDPNAYLKSEAETSLASIPTPSGTNCWTYHSGGRDLPVLDGGRCSSREINAS